MFPEGASPSPPPRPLLLIDVDGVISLFGFAVERPPAGSWMLVDGIPHLISARAGEHLRVLAADFELVWCTGWEEKANDYLPAPLGLQGPLPYLRFDGGESARAGPSLAGDVAPRVISPGSAPAFPGHWKLEAIDAYAGPDRPLAWIDDAHDAACELWAAGRTGPTLLVGTDPAVGITEGDVRRLQREMTAVDRPGLR